MPVVGEYDLVQKLGHGSYADVFKGIHLPTNQRFAVKAISKERIGDRRLQENLTTEISIMRDMRHLNIVGLYNTFENSKYIFLVLELCRGGDLSTFIKRSSGRRLEERIAQSFLRQLADGLYFLSERNIIHRDLKPANVLLSEPSEYAVLKLADFGFAKHLAEASLAHTQCGSPLYMAPEILENQDYDSKADLWSVGCIFFEMLAGTTPFHGTNQRHLLNNILSKPLDIPADVAVGTVSIQLLRDLLKTSPEERLPMTEFHRKCQQELVTLQRPYTSAPSPGKPLDPSTPLATTPTHTSIDSNFSSSQPYSPLGMQAPGPMPSSSPVHGSAPVAPPSAGGHTPPQDIRKSYNSTTTTTLMSLSRNMGALARTTSLGGGSVGASAGTSPQQQTHMQGYGSSGRSRSNSQELYAAQRSGRSRSNSYDYSPSSSPSQKAPSYMAQYHPTHWAQSQPGPQPPLESQLIITDVDQVLTPSRPKNSQTQSQQQVRRFSNSSTHSVSSSEGRLYSTSPVTPTSRPAPSSAKSALSASPVPAMSAWMESVCGTGSFTPLSAKSKSGLGAAGKSPERDVNHTTSSTTPSKDATGGNPPDSLATQSSEPVHTSSSGSDDDFVLVETGVHPWHGLHGVDVSDRPGAVNTAQSKPQSSKGGQNMLSPIREMHSPIESSLCSVASGSNSAVSYRASESSSCLMYPQHAAIESLSTEITSAPQRDRELPQFGSMNLSQQPREQDSSVCTDWQGSGNLNADQALFAAVQRYHAVREVTYMLTVLGDEYVTAALSTSSQATTSSDSSVDTKSDSTSEKPLRPTSEAVASPLPDSTVVRSPTSSAARSRPIELSTDSSSSSECDTPSHRSRDVRHPQHTAPIPIPPTAPLPASIDSHNHPTAQSSSSKDQSDRRNSVGDTGSSLPHNLRIAAVLYTYALQKAQVVLQSVLNLAPSADKFRSDLVTNMKTELLKLFDGLLGRLDSCHETLSLLATKHMQPLNTNAVLYEVACHLNMYIIAREKENQLERACERYPCLLLLLEEVLNNCTSASASAAEIDDELRLNKFCNAVEAQYRDCQSRLRAVNPPQLNHAQSVS